MSLVYKTFYEDKLGDKHFFYTSKDAVLGLKYPDATIFRHTHITDKMFRLGYIIYNTADKVFLNEEFKLEMYRSDTSYPSVPIALDIRLMGAATDGNLNSNFIFNYKAIAAPTDIEISPMYLTREILKFNGVSYTCTSIWLDATDVKCTYMTIVKTVSDKHAPLDSYHLTSGYQIALVNTETIGNHTAPEYSDIEDNVVTTIIGAVGPDVGTSSEQTSIGCKCDGEIEKMLNKLAEIEADIEKLGGSGENYTQIQSDISDIKNTLSTVQSDISTMKTDNTSSFDSVNNSITTLQTTVKNLQTSVSELLTFKSETENNVDTITQNITNLKSNVTSLQNDITSLKTTVSNLQNSQSETNNNIDSIKSTISSMQSTISTLQEQVENSCKCNNSSLEETISNLEKRVTAIENTLANMYTLEDDILTITV